MITCPVECDSARAGAASTVQLNPTLTLPYQLDGTMCSSVRVDLMHVCNIDRNVLYRRMGARNW